MDFGDLLRRLRFREDQLHFGILLAKSAQDGRQDFPGRTRHKCHPQRAAQSRTGAACRENSAFRLDHRAFAFFEKHPARRRQSRDPIGALDQQRSQFLLDLLDGDRERRLGHMQTIGGAPKTELFCDGNKLSKLTQLDHALARRLSIPTAERRLSDQAKKHERIQGRGQATRSRRKASGRGGRRRVARLITDTEFSANRATSAACSLTRLRGRVRVGALFGRLASAWLS